nr:hypothetical protein Iba_chr04dCG13160 [Ipomoea batatas]
MICYLRAKNLYIPNMLGAPDALSEPFVSSQLMDARKASFKVDLVSDAPDALPEPFMSSQLVNARKASFRVDLVSEAPDALSEPFMSSQLVNAYKASFKADLVSNARFLEREFVAGVPTSMANKNELDCICCPGSI